MKPEVINIFYLTMYKFFAISIFFLSLLIVINAIATAREIGRTLGMGLINIAGGALLHTILFITYLLIERGSQGLLTADQIRLFYLFFGTLGSLFMTYGFYQVYSASRKYNIFTP